MERWLQVTLELPGGTVPAAEEALRALGGLSVTLTDPGGEPVLEPGPAEAPLWDRVIVSALFTASISRELLGSALQQALGPETAIIPHFSVLEERNWIADWQRTLAPVRFGPCLWICPPGTDCPDPDGIVVELEPGIAFGTGAHPTTAMCLEWLAQEDLRGLQVLDFGCGSGILAVAALALGAARVTAVDNDPQALTATRENAERNLVAALLEVLAPEDLPPEPRFNVVVANILPDTLISLTPQLRSVCVAGARLVMSGILAAQAERLREACSPWFDLRVVNERDGWILLASALPPGY